MAAEMGTVASLWRYPVKSMRGEELPATEVTEYGLLGDRAYALIDGADGKVATAKNPGKWPTLFGFHATFIEQPKRGAAGAAVRITMPDGATVTSTARECNQVLSTVLKRTVTLASAESGLVSGVQSSLPTSWTGKAEEYWPDMDGLDHRDTVTDFALPTGTFFDGATVHLLTTAMLNRLSELYPQGRFEVPRFRANIVVEMSAKGAGVCRTDVDRSDPGHRRRSPVEDLRPVRPLRHDHSPTGRSAKRQRHLAHGGPAQPGPCRRLCGRRARRDDHARRSREDV